MSTVLGSQGSGNPSEGQGGGNPPAAGGTNPGGAAGGTPAPGSGTGGQASWRDSLPEDMRADPAIQSFSDVTNLTKSYIHAQKALGKKGVIPPTDKSSDDDWSRFYKDIGQPELEKFHVEHPKEVNEGLVKGFKEAAHKSGLLPKQAQGLLNWYLEFEKTSAAARMKGYETSVSEQIQGLEKEWGDGYGKQVALANYVVNEVGGQAFAKYLGETGLGNDVNLIRLFAKIGSALGGEKEIRGDGTGKFGQTPGELQNEIERLSVHPAYANKNHAEHQRVNKELEGLYKKLYAPKAG